MRLFDHLAFLLVGRDQSIIGHIGPYRYCLYYSTIILRYIYRTIAELSLSLNKSNEMVEFIPKIRGTFDFIQYTQFV